MPVTTSSRASARTGDGASAEPATIPAKIILNIVSPKRHQTKKPLNSLP